MTQSFFSKSKLYCLAQLVYMSGHWPDKVVLLHIYKVHIHRSYYTLQLYVIILKNIVGTYRNKAHLVYLWRRSLNNNPRSGFRNRNLGCWKSKVIKVRGNGNYWRHRITTCFDVVLALIFIVFLFAQQRLC